jgi:hypothetical protein
MRASSPTRSRAAADVDEFTATAGALPQGAPPPGAWPPGRPWPQALELDGGHGAVEVVAATMFDEMPLK